MSQQVAVRISLLPWWSAQPIPPKGWLGRDTRALKSMGGLPGPDRGYTIFRSMPTLATDKGGASFVHRHTDGTESIIYWFNGGLYYDDGDATPATLVTGLSDVFNPMFANMASPPGGSIFVNGTDTNARWIREIAGVPVAVAITGQTNGMAAPVDPIVAATGTGGTIPTNSYFVRVCYLDDNGAIVIPTGPNGVAQVVAVTLGQNIVVTEPAAPPGRCSKIRIGVATADTPSSYMKEYEAALNRVGGNHTITALTGTAQAFGNRNGAYAYADWTDLGLTAVSGVIVHKGRYWIWSPADDVLMWSERNTPVFYLSNAVDTGAEGAWNGPIIGCVSAGDSIFVGTPDSIHRVTGSFIRDEEEPNPTYYPDIALETIDHGIGIVSRSMLEIGGRVFAFTTRGPAVIQANGAALLGADHIRPDVRSLWDWTYAGRWVVAEDPDNNYVCFLLTRRTNANRPQDGASTAGIPDTIYRWDMTHNAWVAPIQLDLTHLITRVNGSTQGGTTQLTYLMGMTPHGQCVRLNHGWSGGGAADVSGTNHDGQTASAHTTTSVDGVWSGLSADSEIGRLLTLCYPIGDAAYPADAVQKMIADNDADTLNWQGALAAPSGTDWTVRLAGLLRKLDLRLDLRDWIEAPPDAKIQIHGFEIRYSDVIGLESRS